MILIPEKLKPCPKCGKVEEILGKNDKNDDTMKIKCECVESEEFVFVPHIYGFWNHHCDNMCKQI